MLRHNLKYIRISKNNFRGLFRAPGVNPIKLYRINPRGNCDTSEEDTSFSNGGGNKYLSIKMFPSQDRNLDLVVDLNCNFGYHKLRQRAVASEN